MTKYLEPAGQLYGFFTLVEEKRLGSVRSDVGNRAPLPQLGTGGV